MSLTGAKDAASGVLPAIAERSILDALPAPIYVTDPAGLLTSFNQAAADFWGRRPTLGQARWCGAMRLLHPDERPMDFADSPMALALRDRQPVRDLEAIAERPDGSRIPFLGYPTPLFDSAGTLTGGLNLLVDLTDRSRRDIDMLRLAAIVEGSEDAIVSKTLQGIVTSWNKGAVRIFGYRAEEIVGHSITRIVPPDLLAEEDEILARLKRGERLEHFNTRRVTKDGRELFVSLTVSPLRDRTGRVVGVSKIARDVTPQTEAQQLQRLLFDELNHRVKNTLATIQAIASQSLRHSPDPAEFVRSFNGRVQALARAHELLMRQAMRGSLLHELLHEQVTLGGGEQDARIYLNGPLVMLGAQQAIQIGLVLHELATNARKHGALSLPQGRLDISWSIAPGPPREALLTWQESGLADLKLPSRRGFGTTLVERTLQGSGGQAVMRYTPTGLICELRLPLQDALEPPPPDPEELDGGTRSRRSHEPSLAGCKVLLIEDEPLVALEIESMLAQAECHIVGPAMTLASALDMIAKGGFDVALVDANLNGRTVSEIAIALRTARRPFAFATGYTREALPIGFEEVRLLRKPFGPEQLLKTVRRLLTAAQRGEFDGGR